MTATTKHLSSTPNDVSMSVADHVSPVVSEKLVSEVQELRKVIPHAAQVGAHQTTISLELLEVLLASYGSA